MCQLAGVANRMDDVDPLLPHTQRNDGDDSLTDGDDGTWITTSRSPRSCSPTRPLVVRRRSARPLA